MKNKQNFNQLIANNQDLLNEFKFKVRTVFVDVLYISIILVLAFLQAKNSTLEVELLVIPLLLYGVLAYYFLHKYFKDFSDMKEVIGRIEKVRGDKK